MWRPLWEVNAVSREGGRGKENIIWPQTRHRVSGELEVIVEIDTDRSRRNDSGGEERIYIR